MDRQKRPGQRDAADCAAGGGVPAHAGHLPPEPDRQVPVLRLRGGGPGHAVGLGRCAQLGPGCVLRPGRLCDGDVPQAGGIRRREHQDPDHARHPRLHGLEPADGPAHVVEAVRAPAIRTGGGGGGARHPGVHHRLCHVQAARGRRVLRHHHAGRGPDPDGADHRPAGLHRRRQRHDRPEDHAGLGHPHRQRQVHPLLRLRRSADRLRAAVSVGAEGQGRNPAIGDARQGRPRTLLGLRRVHVQGVRVLPGGGHLGHRRRHVRPAGGLHVALVRGHRAVDRDGHLRRGRRPHEPGRRRVRRAAGELRQDLLLGDLP